MDPKERKFGSGELLQRYSPGCKKYKSIFEELAEEVKYAFPGRNLKFGIMSPANNEHDLNVAKNPTLVFYPSHKQSKRVIFDGDAEDLDDLIDFIEDYLPRQHEVDHEEL